MVFGIRFQDQELIETFGGKYCFCPKNTTLAKGFQFFEKSNCR